MAMPTMAATMNLPQLLLVMGSARLLFERKFLLAAFGSLVEG